MQVLLEQEAAAQERLDSGFGLGHERRELVEPVRSHPVLDGGQQGGAYPASAELGQRGQEDDPALVMGCTSDGGTNHLLALHCHHRVVLLA
ncbi:hypothetical protein AHiyo1_25550 [Arthrobacter sp. Hiyo1]|nr:hypothetical protein AHiyo1_25550 [Arthrobacter sp. Hiyo1]